jgi:hypothetical protein
MADSLSLNMTMSPLPATVIAFDDVVLDGRSASRKERNSAAPLGMLLLAITLPITRVLLNAPGTEMPPPPIPPLHPPCTLLLMMFPRTRGPPKPTPIPAPLQALLAWIILLMIVGEEPLTEMPPHRNSEPGSLPNRSCVKPFRTEPVSFVINSTTVLAPPPSIVVFDAPCKLVTVIALPLKLMFSLYVPSATSTVSPLFAASIAA